MTSHGFHHDETSNSLCHDYKVTLYEMQTLNDLFCPQQETMFAIYYSTQFPFETIY